MTKITEFEKDPGLQELQKVVGGYIEIIPGFTSYKGRSCQAVFNEEGNMMGLPVNAEATQAWQNVAPGRAKQIVGDIAVIYGGLR